MSVTLVVWVALFAVLAVLAFRRLAWGIGLYMMTFFASPTIWWWGDPIASIRWNLYAALILLVAAVATTILRPKPAPLTPGGKWLVLLSLLMLANATAVHFLLARNLAVSGVSYVLMAKFAVLFLLMIAAVRDRHDLGVALLSIVVGAAYIGYEATINERGKIHANRLEGIGAAGVANANELASLMVTVLPLTVPFLLAGRRTERLIALAAAPLTLNVILLCNSRGGFLAGIASGAALLAFAPAKVRRQAALALMLGGVALWLLLGDARIIDRFTTIFVGEEERDGSATSRLLYWGAGLEMISDHPLGAGGHGFNRVYGPGYIAKRGPQYVARSVHNGYINDACEWGVQGLLLRTLFLGGAGVLMISCAKRGAAKGDRFLVLACVALLAGLAAHLVAAVFGDHLDREWGYWIAAMAVAVARVTSASHVDDEENGALFVGDSLKDADEPQPEYAAVTSS